MLILIVLSIIIINYSSMKQNVDHYLNILVLCNCFYVHTNEKKINCIESITSMGSINVSSPMSPIIFFGGPIQFASFEV